MERVMRDFTLWVLCVDDVAHEVLSRLNLSHVRLLRLSQLETDALRSVKPNRTTGEFCWTLTPFSPRFVFEADPAVQRVTYVDADIWFRRNPDAIFADFAGSRKAVLITDHGYAPEHDNTAFAGAYCVQFLTFARGSSEPVRQWWEDRCIEWCHAWLEDGKLGDQKYLDDWPERFPEQVHVLGDQGLALGPWNATRFPYGRGVFYHFHGVRIASARDVEIGSYDLPAPLVENVYLPYLRDLRASVEVLVAASFTPRVQVKPLGATAVVARRFRSAIGSAARLLAAAGTVRGTIKF